MLDIIANSATYLFLGGRTLKLVKNRINITNSTISLVLTKNITLIVIDCCTPPPICIKNFGIELSFQEAPLQVLSSIYNVSRLSSKWISVVPLITLKTPKHKILKYIRII